MLEEADAIVRSKSGGFDLFHFKRESRDGCCESAGGEVCNSGSGGVLHRRVSGASPNECSRRFQVFLAGYVTYSNEAKISSLGVPADLIAEHGAVSEPVARAMAEGARARSKATFALATTGIAGPGGGSNGKPVGTAFLGLAGGGETSVATSVFSDRS